LSARPGRAPETQKATRRAIRKPTLKAPKPRRIRLQTDTRRAQLLELGMDLFAARAYEDIAIDDLAAAAGISKGLLYHYFRGKRDFYVETIRAASLRLRRLSEPDPKLLPVARLRASIDAHRSGFSASTWAAGPRRMPRV